MHCDALLVEDLSQQRLPARTLAAVLERAGWRARLTHFSGDPAGIPSLIELARQAQPQLVVFSILFAHRLHECLALATALRASGVDSRMTLVGPLPALSADELLAACPALDFIVRGEAETALPAWLAQNGRRDNGQAQPVVSPHASLELDILPFALYDDLPACAGYGFATLEASRGCYHACTFCLPCAFYRACGTPYRLRGVPHVVDEIEALVARGVRLFLFDDEQFLPPGRSRQGRVEELASELERRRLRIAFTIKCRADDVDAALLRRLQAIGLVRVYVGLESGCQATLDVLGKGTTVQQNIAALATLDELELVADFRSLLFHPWSTWETIEADVVFLRRVLPHASTCFDFREAEVYAGTPLAARLRAEGRGEGAPWPLPYTIADPRAELLRRLNRIVFADAERRAYRRTLDTITEAWFAFLLQHRFESASFEPERARQIRLQANRVNAEALAVWDEMLAFCRDGDIYDAAQVNARAAHWAARVNRLEIR